MIWIIGAKGMLGQELCLTLEKAELKFTGTDREVDILNPSALTEKANEISPDWIVNCSAYTAVDKAEDDSELAYKINRDGVENIARLAKTLDIPVIHISTDYVFDGSSEVPLKEDAVTGPIGVYGKSKLAGEEVLQSNCSKYFIIRTAWLYGQYGPNFVYTMTKLMNKLDSLKVVNDQIGSPTWANDLAQLISHIIKENSTGYGVYHFSGEGQCSWFDFAREIYFQGKKINLIQSVCEVNPCDSSEFPTKAERPEFSLLSKDRVQSELNIKVPLWQESLFSFLTKFSGLFSRVLNWIEHADYDLETAKAMQNSGRYLYVSITCQQAIEKLIKSIYEYKCRKIPRIHDLTRLVDGINLNQNEKYIQLFKDLSYYYIASRYNERISTLSRDINRERSEKILRETEEVSLWLKSMIPFL